MRRDAGLTMRGLLGIVALITSMAVLAIPPLLPILAPLLYP